MGENMTLSDRRSQFPTQDFTSTNQRMDAPGAIAAPFDSLPRVHFTAKRSATGPYQREKEIGVVQVTPWAAQTIECEEDCPYCSGAETD
jgi:hypothetical protein